MADETKPVETPPAEGAVAPVTPQENNPAPTETGIFDDDGFGSAIAEALAKSQSEMPRTGDTSKPEPEAKPAEEAAPEQTQEPAKAATPADDLAEDPLVKKMNPQQKKAFAAMRTELSSAKRNLEEREKAIAALEEKLKAANPDEFSKVKQDLEAKVDELAKKTAAYEERVRLYDVQNSEEFNKLVTEPLSRMDGTLKGYSAKYAVAEAEIKKALLEPDEFKQSDLLTEVTAGFNERDKLRLFNLAEEYAKVSGLKDKLLKDTQTTLQFLEERRRKEREELDAMAKREMDTALKDSWSFISEKLPLLKQEDNEVLVKAVKDVHERSTKIDVVRMAPVERAQMIHRALVLPILAAAYEVQSAELAELKKKQSAVQKATPSPVGTGTSVNTSEVSDDGLDFADAIARRMGG